MNCHGIHWITSYQSYNWVWAMLRMWMLKVCLWTMSFATLQLFKDSPFIEWIWHGSQRFQEGQYIQIILTWASIFKWQIEHLNSEQSKTVNRFNSASILAFSISSSSTIFCLAQTRSTKCSFSFIKLYFGVFFRDQPRFWAPGTFFRNFLNLAVSFWTLTLTWANVFVFNCAWIFLVLCMLVTVCSQRY